jgi:hypothetical protein
MNRRRFLMALAAIVTAGIPAAKKTLPRGEDGHLVFYKYAQPGMSYLESEATRRWKAEPVGYDVAPRDAPVVTVMGSEIGRSMQQFTNENIRPR